MFCPRGPPARSSACYYSKYSIQRQQVYFLSCLVPLFTAHYRLIENGGEIEKEMERCRMSCSTGKRTYAGERSHMLTQGHTAYHMASILRGRSCHRPHNCAREETRDQSPPLGPRRKNAKETRKPAKFMVRRSNAKVAAVCLLNAVEGLFVCGLYVCTHCQRERVLAFCLRMGQWRALGPRSPGFCR